MLAAVGRAPMAAFVEAGRSPNRQQMGGFLPCSFSCGRVIDLLEFAHEGVLLRPFAHLQALRSAESRRRSL